MFSKSTLAGRYAAIFIVVLPLLLPGQDFPGNQQELLTGAAAALKDELYETAEQYIQQYLRLSSAANKPTPECVIMLAHALHGQRRYADMLALLNKHRPEMETGSFAEPFQYWHALANFDNGQWNTVLAITDSFESRHPESKLTPDVVRLRVKAMLNLGQNAEAIAALQQLIIRHEHDPATSKDRLTLGQILAGFGKTGEACKILEPLLANPPTTATGQKCRNILGQVYIDQQQWDKAKSVYQPLISQKNVPDAYRLKAIESLSEIAAAQSNMEEAVCILNTGFQIAQNQSDKLKLALLKGRHLLSMNRIDEGTALIHDYVIAQNTNAVGARVQLELATKLLASGMNEKAFSEFQLFLESFADHPDSSEAYIGKGTALFNLARYHEAATAFEKAYELCATPEKRSQCRYRVADSLFAAGQYKNAADIYGQIAGITPRTQLAKTALFQTAECQFKLGNIAGAESVLWEVFDDDPNDAMAPRALLRIADRLFQRNEPNKAATVYAWINNDYDDQWRARAFYGLGLIAYRSGDFSSALTCFEQAILMGNNIRNDEVAASALYMSGWSLFLLGKTEEACKRFLTVVEAYRRSSKAPDALFWLGSFDYNRGRFGAAEELFRRLSDDYHQSPLADHALLWSGKSALRQNEFKRGRDCFSSLIKRYPSSRKLPEARYFQGISLCELGQFDAAILIFNEIIRQYPDNELAESAAFKKADCHFILGSEKPQRYEEAINGYQTILDQPGCSLASRLQARYKIGRCLEKLGKFAEALANYLQTVYLYFHNQEQSFSCNLWFSRAAFNAAGIMEDQQQWRKAANIYERVVEADVPASANAQERIDKLRSEHWLSFY